MRALKKKLEMRMWVMYLNPVTRIITQNQIEFIPGISDTFTSIHSPQLILVKQPNNQILNYHEGFWKISFFTWNEKGFLIVVPYTFALPSFNLQTSRRLKRSIVRENELLANLTAEDILPSDSYDEPAYAVELAKISTYFAILGVNHLQ